MLKRILLIILVVALVSIGAVFSFAADKPSDNKVIAYYFHGDFRCPTCHRLEQYSKEAIDTHFKDVLSSGELEFKAVNVDKKTSIHFVNDYQLYTKSLVLSLVRDGKEIKYKNLTKIWEYVGDKQRFFEYVTSEVQDFLKGS